MKNSWVILVGMFVFSGWVVYLACTPVLQQKKLAEDAEDLERAIRLRQVREEEVFLKQYHSFLRYNECPQLCMPVEYFLQGWQIEPRNREACAQDLGLSTDKLIFARRLALEGDL